MVSNTRSGLDPSKDERQMSQENELEQTEYLLLKTIKHHKLGRELQVGRKY